MRQTVRNSYQEAKTVNFNLLWQYDKVQKSFSDLESSEGFANMLFD